MDSEIAAAPVILNMPGKPIIITILLPKPVTVCAIPANIANAAVLII